MKHLGYVLIGFAASFVTVAAVDRYCFPVVPLRVPVDGATVLVGPPGDDESHYGINYRYSVVPGGIYGASDAARIDKTAAEHYDAALQPMDQWHSGKLGEIGSRYYASYRVGDHVYWTSRPILIHAHEQVWLAKGLAQDDQWHLVRMRCGNRLEAGAQAPVAEAGLDRDITARLQAGELDESGAPLTGENPVPLALIGAFSGDIIRASATMGGRTIASFPVSGGSESIGLAGSSAASAVGVFGSGPAAVRVDSSGRLAVAPEPRYAVLVATCAIFLILGYCKNYELRRSQVADGKGQSKEAGRD